MEKQLLNRDSIHHNKELEGQEDFEAAEFINESEGKDEE